MAKKEDFQDDLEEFDFDQEPEEPILSSPPVLKPPALEPITKVPAVLKQKSQNITKPTVIQDDEDLVEILDSPPTVYKSKRKSAEFNIENKRKCVVVDLDDIDQPRDIKENTIEIAQVVEQLDPNLPKISIKLETTDYKKELQQPIAFDKPLSELLKRICKEYPLLKEKELVLVVNELKLYSSTIPDTIGMKQDDKLEIYDQKLYKESQSKMLDIVVKHSVKDQTFRTFKCKVPESEQLFALIAQLSPILGIPNNSIVLERNGIKLYPSVKIASLGLTSGSSLDSYSKDYHDQLVKTRNERFNVVLEEEKELSTESSFSIKIQFNDGDISINVFPSQTFGEIAQIVASKYQKQNVRLFMDGEELEEDDTVQSMDLEQGDILEAKI